MVRRRERSNVASDFTAMRRDHEDYIDQRADYDAAYRGVLDRPRIGIPVAGSGADWHYKIQPTYWRFLETARDIDRNDMLVGQGIDRVVDNVLQDGFTPDPQTGDPEINELLTASWDEWSSDPKQCDASWRLTFRQMERLIFRAAFIVDGDHIVLPMRDGTIQCNESHLLRTPTATRQPVVHGILFDKEGMMRPQEYWLANKTTQPLMPTKLVGDMTKIAARDKDGNRQVYHVLNPKRITQHRGVSALVPVIKACGLHDDALFALLVKQQIANCVTILRSKTSNNEAGLATTVGDTEIRGVPAGTSPIATRLLQHLYPGAEIEAAVGEKVEMFSPNIQTAESLEFSHLILTIIAVNLKIPVHVLLLDPSETNFSGWRGAIDQARVGFRQMAQSYIDCLHSELWRFRVRWQLANDQSERGERLREFYRVAGNDILKHRWNVQKFGYIEPFKDAQADAIRLDKLITSPRRLLMEHGDDWDHVVREAVEDNEYAIELAIQAKLRLAQKYPDEEVHWRECLTLTASSDFAAKIESQEARSGEQNAG